MVWPTMSTSTDERESFHYHYQKIMADPFIFSFAIDLSCRKFLTHLFLRKLNCPSLICNYLPTAIATKNTHRQKYYCSGFKPLQIVN